MFSRTYKYEPNAVGLDGVPIPVWTIRSFTASWAAPLGKSNLPFDSKITVEASKLQARFDSLSGTLKSNLPFDLREVGLVYRDKIYSLPDLPKGGTVQIKLDPQAERALSNWADSNKGGQWQQQPGNIRPAGEFFNPAMVLRDLMFHEKANPHSNVRNHAHRDLDWSWRLAGSEANDAMIQEIMLVAHARQRQWPTGAIASRRRSRIADATLAWRAAGEARHAPPRNIYSRYFARGTPESTMIETRDLTKMYGDLYALDRLTLKLEKGDVYGFIGPNGAGKTTTMRILATLLNPTWGEASVCGYSIYNGAKDIRRMMGYMPDFFGVYDDMKVIEYLEFFAAAYRIKGPERRAEVRSGARPGRSRLQARRPGDQPVARHDAAPRPGSRAAARAAGAAAGRAGQRPRSPRPHRDARPAQGAAQHGQDHPGVQPHPAGAGRHLQQDRHHRARQAALRRRRRSPPSARCASDTVLSVQVANDMNHMAKEQLTSHPDIVSVELKDDEERLLVTLSEGITDGSFIAEMLVKNGFRLKMLKEEEIDLEDVFMGITKGITN